MPAVLGQQRCPNCGKRFKALRPPETARRDCGCGSRWTITFELVEGELASRLGQDAYRAKVGPYVDGRRRRVDDVATPRLFDDSLQVATEAATPEMPKRRRQVKVARGTTFKKQSRG